jgi:hypothetical protein
MLLSGFCYKGCAALPLCDLLWNWAWYIPYSFVALHLACFYQASVTKACAALPLLKFAAL